MKISVWDEIGMEWADIELPIPNDTRDPIEISKALGEYCVEGGPIDEDCESPDGWKVKSHAFAGPIMTIETRSDRNHLAIIVVNYEDQ